MDPFRNIIRLMGNEAKYDDDRNLYEYIIHNLRNMSQSEKELKENYKAIQIAYSDRVFGMLLSGVKLPKADILQAFNEDFFTDSSGDCILVGVSIVMMNNNEQMASDMIHIVMQNLVRIYFEKAYCYEGILAGYS